MDSSWGIMAGGMSNTGDSFSSAGAAAAAVLLAGKNSCCCCCCGGPADSGLPLAVSIGGALEVGARAGWWWRWRWPVAASTTLANPGCCWLDEVKVVAAPDCC